MADTTSLEHDHIVFREMMSHPVLYTHANPNEVTILGDEHQTLLTEVIKHTRVQCIHYITKNNITLSESRPNIHHTIEDPSIWLKKDKQPVDIIINLNTMNFDHAQHFYKILKPHGILLQLCDLLVQTDLLKKFAEYCQKVGFKDLQILHFPQSYGSKSALMALKQGAFKRLREKEIFNKNFDTYYYNFDMHKAAIALPEFLKREWSS